MVVFTSTTVLLEVSGSEEFHCTRVTCAVMSSCVALFLSTPLETDQMCDVKIVISSIHAKVRMCFYSLGCLLYLWWVSGH